MPNKSSKKIGQRILSRHVPNLRDSLFYNNDFLPCLNRVVDSLGDRKLGHIICYGLGSFHDSAEIASRFQLALLFLMHERLVELRSPLNNVVHIFDPSFETADIEILRSFSGLEFNLIEDNEYCARRIETCAPDHVTLVYMPHLDKYLYNNLLGANWCARNLRNLVVLGNSFQAMIDYELSTKCKSELYYLNLLVTNFRDEERKERHRKKPCEDIKHGGITKTPGPEALLEFKIETSDLQFWDIFNNFAFHYVDDSWIRDNIATIDRYRLDGWVRAVNTDPIVTG